ncbi:hypothetical protein [Paraflavitalea speifideaquila]|nr:hypothetical protein [Paraflavitalea speifideiaquila]
MWLSAAGDGLCYFDEATGRFVKIRPDTSLDKAVATPISMS